MQQLAGDQRKPVAASNNKPTARVLPEAGVPRRQHARLIQPHLIEA